MKSYPLKPLLDLRRQKRDQHVTTLAQRVNETEERQRQLGEVGEQQRSTTELARRVRAEEVERAEQQTATALDLQRLAAHDTATRQRLVELKHREQEVARRLEQARSRALDAQRALTSAEVELSTVEGHRERFERQVQQTAERRQEEEAQEVYDARGRR